MPSPLRVAAVALLLAACQRVPLDEDPIGDDDDTGDTDGTPTEDNPDPSAVDGGDPNPLFGCEPGDPSSCPMGQKCTALAEGGFQNKFQCVTDDGELAEGDQCTPAVGTGQDKCVAGTVCLTTSEESTLGRCIRVCSSDVDCEPGRCTESPLTLTPFCGDACDPLLPDCLLGQVCAQSNDRFICGIASQDDVGVTAEQCFPTTLRGCAEGYACMSGALVPGCSSDACCAAVCDLNGDSGQCSAPAQCEVLFATPAPGFDNVGACYVPT